MKKFLNHVYCRHGADADTVVEKDEQIHIELTKSQVTDALLKAHPTWEKRGQRIYNGVGEPVKILWDYVDEA